MPESPIHNQDPGAVLGGTSTTPTPANNVGGGAGWGDESFKKGGTGSDDEDYHGSSHMSAAIGAATCLQHQKTRAKYHFLNQSDDAANVKPMSVHGEPTCASEDHSFMNHKPGGSETMPGWGIMRNIMGAMGGHSS